MSEPVTRRDMLRWLSLGMVGGSFLPALACARTDDEEFAQTPGTSAGALDDPTLLRLDRIGLQLYTVRSALAKDLEGTIAAAAAAGVNELEFAGYYDRDANWWKAVLDRHQLTAPATHIGLPAKDEDWAPHFERANAMGHRYVIVPSSAREFRSPDGWKRLAERLNAGGELANRAGLRMGYHNHDYELSGAEGARGLDVLLANTSPELVDFELDLYWVVKAGADPLTIMRAHPTRFACCHVKDAGPPPERAMLDVGAGTIDFKSILAAGRSQALRHWFIEHDNPRDPLETVRRGAAALKAM